MRTIHLTLASNKKPTYINPKSVAQIYQDTNNEGLMCTRIDFIGGDYTKVMENLASVNDMLSNKNVVYGMYYPDYYPEYQDKEDDYDI